MSQTKEDAAQAEVSRKAFWDGLPSAKKRREATREVVAKGGWFRKPRAEKVEVKPSEFSKLKHVEMPALSLGTARRCFRIPEPGEAVYDPTTMLDAAVAVIYDRVLADINFQASLIKEYDKKGGVIAGITESTKWKNAQLKWWRAALGLNEKGLPL